MKKILGIFSIGVLVLAVFFAGKNAIASGFSAKNILKSVNVLGFGLVKNDSVKMTMVYESESDGINDQEIQLPELSGNDGMIYITKFKQDVNGNTGTGAYVKAYGSDKIDATTDYVYFGGIYYPKDALILVADEENGSWWVVGSNKY